MCTMLYLILGKGSEEHIKGTLSISCPRYRALSLAHGKQYSTSFRPVVRQQREHFVDTFDDFDGFDGTGHDAVQRRPSF